MDNYWESAIWASATKTTLKLAAQLDPLSWRVENMKARENQKNVLYIQMIKLQCEVFPINNF